MTKPSSSLPPGILDDDERQLISELFADNTAAADDHLDVLRQLKTVLEEADQSGLRQESMQIIQDVLGRAVARRHLVDDEGLDAGD